RNSVVFPERPDHFLLTENQVCCQTFTRDAGEFSQRAFGACFDVNRMTNQRNSFQCAAGIAASVEDSTMAVTDNSVVAYEAAHHERMQGALFQELENLFCFRIFQAARD